MSRDLSPYPLYAFYVLESALRGISPAYNLNDFKRLLNYTGEEIASPLFVTWKITNPQRGQDKELRGCIGNFSPLDLSEGVGEYARIAAFEDHRFSPITERELVYLTVDVTLLQHFEEVDDPYDWVVGTHGVRVSFKANGKYYSSTFLPEVAFEHGWDKEETLHHLVLKSGYGRKLDFKQLSLTRYQGVKSGVSFQDYRNFMQKVSGDE